MSSIFSVPPTVFFLKTQASVICEQMGASMKTGQQHFSRPMHAVQQHRTSRSRHLTSSPSFTLEETGGLGFSLGVRMEGSIA
jgi:hypothetical protein